MTLLKTFPLIDMYRNKCIDIYVPAREAGGAAQNHNMAKVLVLNINYLTFRFQKLHDILNIHEINLKYPDNGGRRSCAGS